jgi:integrase
MSIRKRTLPSGKTSWLVDYSDLQGKRRSRQFRTKEQATTFETTTRNEILAGTHTPDAASITIKAAGGLWLDKCRLEGLEQSTLKQYKQHLDHHVTPFIGGVRLSRLTKPSVVAFRNKLLATRSKAMAAKVMVSLKSLISAAQESGLIVQNAASGVRVKRDSRHEDKVTIPEKSEIRTIIATANEWPVNEVGRAIVITALFSGMRASELRGLNWGCVDFDKKIIRVEQRADFRCRLGSPKSKAGNRDVPMSPMVAATLRRWRLCCPKSEAELVFPTSRGGIITHSGMHRIWHNLLDEAGLPKRYRFHDLLHVCASLLIEQGWQAKQIQVVMGHANISMTLGVYGHLWATPEDDAAAMAQLEARLLRSAT